MDLEQQQRGDVARQGGLDQIGVQNGFDQHRLEVRHGGPPLAQTSADRAAEAAQQRQLDVGHLVAAHANLTCAAHHAIEHRQAELHVHLEYDAAGQRLQLDQVH